MTILIDRINGLESSTAVKVPVVAATTGPITASGLQTIDTVVLAEGDRVLRKDESDLTLNGLYNVVASGLWTRCLDFDGPRDVLNGTCVYVTGGTEDNIKHFFQLIVGANTDADGNVVFEQTELTFEKIFFESETFAQEAQDAAADAEEARIATEAAAAAIATSLQGTSTTSIAIATGSKVFATQTQRAFGSGVFVLIQSAANAANYMHGRVTSYVGGSLTVNVTSFGETGTLNDWVISVSGPQGTQGNAGAAGAGTGDMLKSENLSGLANYATARSNLGLGALAVINSATVDVGGTGRTSHTAYAVICGGTSTTNPQQSVASLGTAGQILTSNGAGALPSFQTASNEWTYGSISSNTGSSLDISALPSGISEIEIFLVDCQTSGTQAPYLQLRDSGGLEATGYVGQVWSSLSGIALISTSFLLANGYANNAPLNGSIDLKKVDLSANTWSMKSSLSVVSGSNALYGTAGSKTLSAELDGFSVVTPSTWIGGSVYYRYK